MPRFLRPGALVAALVAAGALTFDPGGWFTFGPLKWVIITVLAVGSAALAFGGGSALHRPSTTAWAALLVWAALTSLLADDALSAWLGTPDRRFGFVALATLACAYVSGQAVDDAHQRTLVARGVVVALLGMTLYGIFEFVGIDPVQLTTTTGRLGATYGSAAYLGAALALFLPVAVGAASEEPTGPWRWAAFVSVLGGVALLAGSGTRAALVGLVAAAILSLPRWIGAMRSAVVCGVVVVLVTAMGFSPLVSRAVAPSVEGRMDEWRIGWAAYVADPWNGVGLEGYRVVFPRHVDAAYVQDYGRTTVTDRAHSGPLDMGISLGLPGLVAWWAAFVFLTVEGWRAFRHESRIVAGIGAGLVAMLVQELLLFPTLEVGVAGWALAGVIVAANRVSSTVRSSTAAATLGLLATVALVFGALDVAADHRAAAAREANELAMADRASELRPDSFRYPLLAAQTAWEQGDASAAHARIQDARLLSPLDPALRLAEARTVTALVATGAVPAEEALAVVDGAVTSDPHHPELRLLHGELLAAAGRPGEAERAWLAAAHLAPEDPDPLSRLSRLYAAAGRDDLAEEAAARAAAVQPETSSENP